MTIKRTNFVPALKTSFGVLFQTDCLRLLERVSDESLDTVFADPPFNIGKEYNNGKSDAIHNGAYLEWSCRWIAEAVRVLKPGGSLFIYILPRWGYQFATFLEELGMEFRHWIALTMKGTYPRGKKLYPAHYCILYFTKGEPRVFNRDSVRTPIPLCRHCGKETKDYGGHRNKMNPLGVNLADFWDDTSPARHRKDKSRWHINELKPIIPERCILLSTNPGDVVLDPFGGGGSTFVVAEHYGRFWIGSELGPVEPIAQRFRREFLFFEQSDHAPARLSTILGLPGSEERPPCQKSSMSDTTMGLRNEFVG